MKKINPNSILKALVSDLSGGLKEIIFPGNVYNELIKKGVAYDGSSFVGINSINCSDAIILGDPDTVISIPKNIREIEDKEEYWIICDILDVQKNPHPNCARIHLKKMQEKLAKIWDGGTMFTGAEPEAFFVEQKNREKMDKNMGGNMNYFNPKDPKSFLITEILEVLENVGFKIERAHSEVGDDQFEINWQYDTAHRTADKVQIYKLIAHKVARNYGYDVTFLPKPYPNRSGSGMHIHISVANKEKNLFYDAKKKSQKNFSDKALQFLSGINKYSRAISAVANPTEVSFARLVPGYEAPCVIAIGSFNRSISCRIPALNDEKIISKAIRAEFRFPDPLANPYLLSISFIAAGILGIKKKEKFKGFCEENLYEYSTQQLKQKRYKLLPRNLWEAYSEFIMHPDFIESFGKTIHKSYAQIILDEINDCQPYANIFSIKKHYFR